MRKFNSIKFFIIFSGLYLIVNAINSQVLVKRQITPTPIASSTTEDWRWKMLATLTSPEPTTTKKPEMDFWQKYLYFKYGITPPPTTGRSRIITGYDTEPPPPAPSTTTPAPKHGNATKSYLNFVLDKWLEEGRKSKHSYTDVHAGLPLSPTDIPKYETYFGHH